MPYGKGRTLQKIQQFIKGRLPQKLAADLRRLQIVKEADLECSVYFHLRRYIGEDSRWRILARKHLPATGHYVDLLIYDHHFRPAVALELKWNQPNIDKKDRQSLSRVTTRLRVSKVYWISAVMAGEKKTKLEKRDEEKYHLRRIIVPLTLTGKKKAAWKTQRKRLRA
jgi:hypothetical protein